MIVSKPEGRRRRRVYRLPRELRWQTETIWLFVVRGPRSSLALMITPTGDEYGAAALESAGRTAIEVTEAHAHKIVGTFPTFEDAERALRDFATTWLEVNAAAELERCDCREIEASR